MSLAGAGAGAGAPPRRAIIEIYKQSSVAGQGTGMVKANIFEKFPALQPPSRAPIQGPRKTKSTQEAPASR